LFLGSFDGSLATGWKQTGVRCVCANTIALAMKGGMDMKSKHTKNTHKRLADYRDQVQANLRSFNTEVAMMRDLATKKTTRAAQVQYVYDSFLNPVEQKLLKDGELPTKTLNKVNTVIELLDTQKGIDLVPAIRGTAWQAYNAISEYLTHEAGRTDDSRVNSQWFGAGAALNAKAMQLAQAM
jgi:phage/plasmid-like protein (TIGR03299 family)